MQYLQPGHPPADCQTADLEGFYSDRPASRNFALATPAGATVCFGASALAEREVGIGQYPRHEVHGINGTP